MKSYNFTFSILCVIIQVKCRTSCSNHCFQCTAHSTTHILHTEEFSAALLHAENVKQLFCTIVCSLMMGQEGLQRVGAGVL